MRFSITGVNHKSAPVEVRERLAFDEPSLAAALLDLRGPDSFNLQSGGGSFDL
jgi:glutamyl-tRNA reductase